PSVSLGQLPAHNLLDPSQGVDVRLRRTQLTSAGPYREMGSSQFLPDLGLGDPVLWPMACHGDTTLHADGCRVTARLLGVALHPGNGLSPSLARGEHGKPAIGEAANPAQGRFGWNGAHRPACSYPYGDRTLDWERV